MTNNELKKQIAKTMGCSEKDVVATVKVKGDGEYESKVTAAGKDVTTYCGFASGISDARNKALKAAVESLKPEDEKKVVKVGELCHCGCGEMTKYKRIFRQGHDARFHGRVKKLQDGRNKLADFEVQKYALDFYKAELI